jgi:polyhydroxyalkanoate synthesis regulator phasin
MNTHLIITNRAASVADGWIHIVPKGELPNRAAGLVQVLDDAALDSILAGIEADRQRLGNKWPGIYAGREHFIYNDEADSAALAWFKEFEKRADGIWAKADGLTPTGKQVIANDEYKFTSFVADRKDTQKLDGQRVRILKLDTVGFTNQANGKELLTPITNRNTFPAASASGASPNNNNERPKTMKNIAQKLGLAPEASEDAILGEVTKLQNRVTQLEPLGTENETLKNRLAESDAAQVTALFSERKITDAKVINRLTPVLSALKNREERLACLDDLGHKAVAATAASGGTRILNRADGRPATEATDASDEQAKAEKIRNRATELQDSKKLPFDAAWAQASREIAAGK